MATIAAELGRRVALDRIRVPENVRVLDDAHVQALAGSIALQGMLLPLVVHDAGDAFELVAGFHRNSAAAAGPRWIRSGRYADAAYHFAAPLGARRPNRHYLEVGINPLHPAPASA